jgi:hypothetical protein
MMQIWNNKNTSLPTSDTDHGNHTSLAARCEKVSHFWFFNFSMFTTLFIHILIFSIFFGPGTYNTLHNLQANTAIKKILINIFYNATPTSKYFISSCLKSHGMYVLQTQQTTKQWKIINCVTTWPNIWWQENSSKSSISYHYSMLPLQFPHTDKLFMKAGV